MSDTLQELPNTESSNPPSVQWRKVGNPHDGWYGTVYGRIQVWGKWGGFRVFHGVEYCAVRGWRFEITRNKGMSGGFASWESITENRPIEVTAWLEVVGE